MPDLLTDLSDACAAREVVDIEKQSWAAERQSALFDHRCSCLAKGVVANFALAIDATELFIDLSEERACREVLEQHQLEVKCESANVKGRLETELARLQLVCEAHKDSVGKLTSRLQATEQSRKADADALGRESRARVAVERLLETEREARVRIEANIECLKGIPSVIVPSLTRACLLVAQLTDKVV